jgi:hypothetical protein
MTSSLLDEALYRLDSVATYPFIVAPRHARLHIKAIQRVTSELRRRLEAADT